MSRWGKIAYLGAAISAVVYVVLVFFLSRMVSAVYLYAPLALALVFVLVALGIDYKFYLEFLGMKTTRDGMSMGLSILLVVILLVALNVLALRHTFQWDLSSESLNSLSPQTKKILDSLDDKLKVLFFYQKGDRGADQQRGQFREVIRLYQDYSSKVSLDFIEINARPDLAAEYEVKSGGGIVFLNYKDRKNRIEKIGEEEITRALIKVTKEKEHPLYFISGHGERDLEDNSSGKGLNALKKVLEGNRYKVHNLNLVEQGSIPEEAKVLAIVGPSQTFLDHELKLLEAFLAKGGRLLVALEPETPHGLSPLFLKLGIQLHNNYVVTVMQTLFGRIVNPSKTPASEFSTQHKVTKVFKKGQFVAFRLPMSLTGQSSSTSSLVKSLEVEELVKTSKNSLAYKNKNLKGKVLGNGPFSIMVAVKGQWGNPAHEASSSTSNKDANVDKKEESKDKAKKSFEVVVVGDSDFLSNQLLFHNLNRDLALNAFSHLVGEEDLISISPKGVEATKIRLSSGGFMTFVFAFVIPLPLLLIITSLLMWFRRRAL